MYKILQFSSRYAFFIRKKGWRDIYRTRVLEHIEIRAIAYLDERKILLRSNNLDIFIGQFGRQRSDRFE